VAPVGQIDETALTMDLELVERVRGALAREPWEPLGAGGPSGTDHEGER